MPENADDPTSTSGTAMAAQHAVAPRKALNVAPTDGSTRFNTVRIPLIPQACFRLNDPAFAFDSSFVGPAFQPELATLSGIVAANQGCPVAIFGHCDPAGSDALNKTLGDRRAIAVYALVTRQPAMWEDLYSKPAVGDTWGTSAIQAMLANLTGRTVDDTGAAVADPSSTPYYARAVDGDNGPVTSGAVKAFQRDSGNTPDGQAGPATRKALFGAYMDWLCTPSADPSAGASATTSSRFLMQPTDFLGGEGAAAGDLPKMALQSCGKFNPIVLLTNTEMNGDDKTTRNDDDAPNRRVILFFFPKGTKVDSSVWPCPKVKDANDACKQAFWPDGDQRRQNTDSMRLYRDTKDTMACRFYDRFARRSPCEKHNPFPFQIAVVAMQDAPRQPLTSTTYKLTLRTGDVINGTTDATGKLQYQYTLPGDHTLDVAGGSTKVPAIPMGWSALSWVVLGTGPDVPDTSSDDAGAGSGGGGSSGDTNTSSADGTGDSASGDATSSSSDAGTSSGAE